MTSPVGVINFLNINSNNNNNNNNTRHVHVYNGNGQWQQTYHIDMSANPRASQILTNVRAQHPRHLGRMVIVRMNPNNNHQMEFMNVHGNRTYQNIEPNLGFINGHSHALAAIEEALPPNNTPTNLEGKVVLMNVNHEGGTKKKKKTTTKKKKTTTKKKATTKKKK